ncbi:O-acetylhomoserine (thiol)-lyase [Clostridium bornimense]|uniref:homocysteine desulfhydrase n=1 Tax=Clostridium bornimense TaxID=1216932 RepID=W6SCZ6_9CLOT|nr:O-acetylhomoserine aminocarboxypropyltransferase/cysteine synthase family protein [Clostridium bornimense]CDM67470.1 O-acetylhomoserine (thiol)-lyase [Clostridium bornimense]
MGENYRIGTIAIKGGYNPKGGEPKVVPIVQSATYEQDDPEFVAKVFNLEADGYLYGRTGNPTVTALEEKFAELEKGVAAVATACGQAAVVYSILALAKAGDHIIASSAVYGGTYNLLKINLPKLGIETTFVDPEASKEEILKVAKSNTKAIYGETIGNPGLNVLDFEKFAAVAKELDIPFIVDNTIATPYLVNPIDYGANVVVHSTTKYANGHADALGGIIVDGGNFNWDNGKFPEFVEEDPSYHGISFVKNFGKSAYATKIHSTLIRDFGAIPAPVNAFLTNRGLETLHLRVQRHSENALKLAKYLESHPKVSWVNYPYLESSSQYNRAKKYLRGGGSGILTFGLKGGEAVAGKLIENLKVTSLVVNLGDVRSYIIHPWSTTHAQLSSEEKIKSGVLPDLLRVSVGVEDINDIIEDYSEALEKI